MEKENFTAGRIASYKFKPSATGKANQTIYWDAKTPGLCLRVTASGNKSFAFETKLHGRTLRITIGDARTWSIGDAQKEATDLKAMVDKGIDPRKQRAVQKAEADAEHQVAEGRETTFGDAWKAYMTARKPKWSPRHFTDHEKVISVGKTPGPLADLLEDRLSEITPERVKAWLDDPKQTARPTYTSIAFRKLRAFLTWASDQSEYSANIATDACSRKVATDRVAKTKSKDDCLQREQIKPWFDAVKMLSNTVVSAYLQCLLLTGARREEMATLRWENVDLKWKSLTIKDKIEGERTIPLTPYVEGLLRELEAINKTPPPEYRILHGKKVANKLDQWKPSEWVFFSTNAQSGHIVEPRIGHNRALSCAGLPDLSLHGLRRSFGTLAEWVECPVGISAQIMGHKPSALAEKHYRKRPIDLLRMWHTKIEAWILEQGGICLPVENTELKGIESSITA
jgi:integrase